MTDPENILLSFFVRGKILSIDVATAKEVDELDPGDPSACSDFVELVKDNLRILREAAETEET